MILRKSTLLVLSLTILFVFLENKSLSQEILGLSVSSAMGETGTRVCLDVTAENFTDIESIQFNLSYNATLVVPECPPAYIHPLMQNSLFNPIFNCNNKNNGFINFVWASNPTTIPDGEVIFTLCFNIIGEPGNKSPVYFNGFILDVEVCALDQNGNSKCTDELNSNVGTIMIISNTLDVFFSKCDADVNNITDGGNVTIYGTGGTPPYNYTINPGGYTGSLAFDGQRITVPNIAPNNYTLSLTDSGGNPAVVKIFNISDNIPLKIDDIFVKDPTCADKSNGKIKINSVSGGITPYKYEWSNLISGLDSIVDLKINTYTVTVTDLTGCKKTATFDLKVDTLKFDLLIKDTASCAMAKNGIISIVNVVGGTKWPSPNYEYQIGSFNWKRSDMPLDITSIGSGTYVIGVRDSMRCEVKKTIVMPFKKTVVANIIEKKDITCSGLNDGSIRIQAGPGSGYAYIPDPKMLDNGVLGGVFVGNNLSAGSYIVTARDGDGCTGDVTFSIIDPEPIIINEVVVQPDCINTGSITLNPTGGTGMYTYNWNPVSGNVNFLTGLLGGSYSVTVTDSNNCNATYSVSLNQQGSLNITPEIIKPISCNGLMDGNLRVDILSLNGPFTIIWKDNNNVTIGNTQTITNLGPGVYTVQVTDNTNCSNSKQITLTDPLPVTITSTLTNAPCFDTNGKVIVSVSGDPSGFTYEWNVKGNPTIIDTDNTLDDKSGIYEVKVKSPAGCEEILEVTINQPLAITFPIPSTRNVTCFGLATGQAAIMGAPAGLNFIWSSGSNGPFAINLIAGPGWVVAENGPCLSDTTFFNIGTFPLLEIDDSKTFEINPTCFGDTNGSVTIEAKGGTATGYTYFWDNGATTASLTNIGAGDHIVIITDSNNCSQTDTFRLTQPERLVATIDKTGSVELDCKNQDAGKIALTTTGGNPGRKTIAWQSGVIVDNSVAVGLSPGTYCATVSDNFGCKDSICYTLSASAPLKGELNTPAEPLCFGDKTCISVNSISGGTGNQYTFQINNGIRYPTDSCVTVFAGQYFINLIDSAGCSIDTIITIGQPDPIEVILGPDQEIQLGLNSSTIDASVISSVGIDTLVWTPNTNINCLNLDCTSIEANPIETTTYLLTVTDENGCKGSDEIIIKVKDVRNVFFANIFSPNLDGNNDYFQAVIGPGVEEIVSFNIFDRWGNMVFEKTNYMPDPAGTDGWDGTFNQRKLDPGVFVYYAKVRFFDGKIIDYSGSVTIVDKLRN